MLTVAAAAALFIGACLPARQRAAAPHWPVGCGDPVSIDPRHALRRTCVRRTCDEDVDRRCRRRFTLKMTAMRRRALRVRFVSSDAVFGEARPRVDPGTGAIVAAECHQRRRVGDASSSGSSSTHRTPRMGHALGLPHTDEFAPSCKLPSPDEARAFRRVSTTIAIGRGLGSPIATGLAQPTSRASTLYDRFKPNTLSAVTISLSP